jgi:hypothetical protein
MITVKQRCRLVLVGLLAFGLAEACAAQTRGAQPNKTASALHPRPLVPLNSNLLPRYSRPIPPGPAKVTFKNPYHFKAVYGLRCGPQGKDFRLEGKEKVTFALPDGEYIIFFRFIHNAQIQESISFTIEDGDFALEDPKKSQYAQKAGERGWAFNHPKEGVPAALAPDR